LLVWPERSAGFNAQQQLAVEEQHLLEYYLACTQTTTDRPKAIRDAVRYSENRFQNIHPHGKRVERQRVDAEGWPKRHRRGKVCFRTRRARIKSASRRNLRFKQLLYARFQVVECLNMCLTKCPSPFAPNEKTIHLKCEECCYNDCEEESLALRTSVKIFLTTNDVEILEDSLNNRKTTIHRLCSIKFSGR